MIKEYKIRWLEHRKRVSPGRIPQEAYRPVRRPKGRRGLGQSNQWWEPEAGAGNTTSSWTEDDDDDVCYLYGVPE